MNAKFSRLLTIVFFLLAIVGLGSIGFNLIATYLQTKQISQIQEANNFLAQKKYSSAVAAYDQLLESNSAESYILWANRGSALLGLKEYQTALRSCSKATSIYQRADLAWNCRGEALFYLGQYDAALTAFQRAIAINPRHATFWLNQNKVLLKLSQHLRAISANKQAIALLQSQPQNPPNLEYLAIALRRQGHSWLALQENQQALVHGDLA